MRRVRDRSQGSPRRGIAMLLVLICLMMATILSTAYLSSRDNSASIGANVSDAAAARAAAASGLELALSIMGTELEWQTTHNAGLLLENYAMAGATVDVELLDLETTQPPTLNTAFVHVLATAHVGQISQSASAVAFVHTAADGSINIDLAEFAVFSQGVIRLTGQTRISRWQTAPLYGLGMPLPIGTQAIGSGDVSIEAGAAIHDGVVYTGPYASETLINNISPVPVQQHSLSDDVPLTPPPPPPPPEGGTRSLLQFLLDLATGLLTSGRTYEDATIDNSQLTLDGDMVLTIEGNLTMVNNARILVAGGNPHVVVHGDLDMDLSAIEIAAGTTLRLYIGGALRARDSYIGDARIADVRDTSGGAQWMNGRRLLMYTIAPDSGTTTWRLRDTSVVKASIYAPTADFRLENQSVLYGRAAAAFVRISDYAAIFFDPGLNRINGFTNTASRLYDGDTVRSAVRSMDSLAASELSDLAATLRSRVFIGTRTYGTRDPIVDADDVAAGAPTPRPVAVSFGIKSIGADMRLMEVR